MNSVAYGEAFHITSNENVTWGMVLDIIGEYYNVEVNRKDFTIDLFSKKYPLYKDIVLGDKGNEMRFDNTKIKNAVSDLKFEVSLKQGIYETLDFYEQNEEFQRIDYYWYGKIDRICKCKNKEKISNIK